MHEFRLKISPSPLYNYYKVFWKISVSISSWSTAFMLAHSGSLVLMDAVLLTVRCRIFSGAATYSFISTQRREVLWTSFHSPRAGTPAHLCCAVKFQKPENMFYTNQRIRAYPLFRERPLKKKKKRGIRRERGGLQLVHRLKCSTLLQCIMDFFLRPGYEPKLTGSSN